MPGTYQYDVEIKSNVAKLLSDMKQVQDRLDTVEGKEYKIKLNVDEKKLSNVISNLEKMLDSLGKGTGDFKQFENLSKELSSIVSEVQSLSKAFGKVDDSGAKTLLSSIQNIDKSLAELSQNILNVNKNMSNMGGNTSGAVKQVENISNAYQDAAKEAEKLADAQSKIRQKTNISSGTENSTISLYDNVVDKLNKILELRQKIAQSPTLENGLEGKGEFLKFAEQYKWSPYKDTGFLGESNIKAGYGIYTKAQTKFAKGEVDETYVNNAYTTFVKILTDNLVHSVSGITTGKTDVDYIKQRLQEILPKKMSSFIQEYLDNITSFSKRNAEYNSGGNYIDEESKALKELIELGSGVNQRAEDIFTIDAKDDLQNLFDETKISAENFQSVLESVCNILGIEIPQNTEKAKESIKEVTSTTDSPSSTSNPSIEQQIKSESELNAEIEKRENIIRELQQLQEKLTVHEDFHGNDRYFADQLPTEEEIREADKRIKQLTGTNNIFNVDKLIQDRNEWLSEVKYSLEEYDDLIKTNDQKAFDEYTTRGLSRIGGAESFFGYEDDNFSIASKFVEEKEKIQNEINDLYIDLDKLDEKMNLDSNDSSVDNTVQSQEKLQSELKETQKQAEKTAQAVKESTTTASQDQRKDAFHDQDVSASVESATNSIKEENNVLEQNTQKIKENTQAKEQNANVNLNKYDKRLDSYNGKIDKYKTTIDRFNDGGWTSNTYLENVQAVKNAVKEYETLLNELKGKDASLVTSDDISKLDEYEKKIKDTIATVTNMSASEKGYNFVSGQKELDKIHKLLAENSKMSSDAKAKIKAYYAEIESGNPSMSLDKIHGEILKIYNAEVEAGRAGRTLWDTLKNSGFHQIAAQMAGMVGVYDVINLGKEGFNVVRELNTALTEMRKVSDESIQTLKDYQKESFNTADAIATTGLQMQNSIADWQRLGYSIKEANELAKNSNIYKNVGDMDISTATEHMVSSVQAWKSEFNDDAVKTSEEVMNRYNKIGNEFAISSADIGEAMETSAAALKAGGNDLNEALGIITAGNIIQQDASTTSSAMKILSLRIRGAKADLESMGESTDDLADSTSKLREEIKGLTGVDIMADEDTFKSTAEIIKEIGAVWNQLSDVSQAATLEKLAGKNRASTVAGLIENYETIDKVIEAASNADNSALDENQKIIESIDGRIQQLSNRVQEFWYNLVDDSVVKNAVSALTTIVEGGTKLIDTFGALPTLLTAIGAGLSFKNVGEWNYISKFHSNNIICFIV